MAILVMNAGLGFDFGALKRVATVCINLKIVWINQNKIYRFVLFYCCVYPFSPVWPCVAEIIICIAWYGIGSVEIVSKSRWGLWEV